MNKKEFKRQVQAAMKDTGKVFVLSHGWYTDTIRIRIMTPGQITLWDCVLKKSKKKTLLQNIPQNRYNKYIKADYLQFDNCCWDNPYYSLNERIDRLWIYHKEVSSDSPIEVYGIDKKGTAWSYA